MVKYVMDHKGKPHRKYFEDISAIPRDSFQEHQIADYLIDFAKERGFWSYRDKVHNVIIKKPASKGYEDHPTVMIQAHTDMVCVKTPDSNHNFETDPLELIVKDGWLKAHKTTLGADNGHGVAYMLAILDDNKMKHPPLECFFSVQEEAGMGGSGSMDYSIFSAQRLINIDIMEEGVATLVTASVVGGDFIKKVQFEENSLNTYKLEIGNCAAGHAALNIGCDQANPIKLCARIMYRLLNKSAIRLVSINGGTIRNNIPMDANVTFTCQAGDLETIEAEIKKLEKEIKYEYDGTDPAMYISLKAIDIAPKCLTSLSTRSAIELLVTMPAGTMNRSFMSTGLGKIVSNGVRPDIGLVNASRNLGTIELKDDRIIFGYIFRSRHNSMIEEMMEQSMLIANIYGANYNKLYSYPGWTIPEDNIVNNIWSEVYEEATGKKVLMNAIHGGMDVGSILTGLKGIPATAIGPETIMVHTPEEAMNIESFDNCYVWVQRMLERL